MAQKCGLRSTKLSLVFFREFLYSTRFALNNVLLAILQFAVCGSLKNNAVVVAILYLLCGGFSSGRQSFGGSPPSPT